MDDIKRNFEFLYMGHSRRMMPDLTKLDIPLEEIKNFGGMEIMTFQDYSSSDNVDEHYNRSCGFEFRVFEFKDSRLKVYFTREQYPDDSRKPNRITRVRIGNYDLVNKRESEKAISLSEALSRIPSSV